MLWKWWIISKKQLWKNIKSILYKTSSQYNIKLLVQIKFSIVDWEEIFIWKLSILIAYSSFKYKNDLITNLQKLFSDTEYLWRNKKLSWRRTLDFYLLDYVEQRLGYLNDFIDCTYWFQKNPHFEHLCWNDWKIVNYVYVYKVFLL